MEEEIIFYTDGGCQGNPGPGGYGIIGLRRKVIEYQYSAFEGHTTNNRMELKAILHMLELAQRNPEINFIVYSDSAYAIQSVTNWIYNWANNGWQNSRKVTVENVDIMKEIYEYVRFPLPNFQLNKTQGHKGILGNELVDAICTKNEKKFNKLVQEHGLIIKEESEII